MATVTRVEAGDVHSPCQKRAGMGVSVAES